MDLIEGIKTVHVRDSVNNRVLAKLWEMDLIEGIKTAFSLYTSLGIAFASYEKWTW